MQAGSVMRRERACGRGTKAREICGWWMGVWKGEAQGLEAYSAGSGSHPGWSTRVVFVVKQSPHLWFRTKKNLLCACVDNKLSRERQNRESDVCCLEEWAGEHWAAGRFWAQCDGGKHSCGRPVGWREGARSLEGLCIRNQNHAKSQLSGGGCRYRGRGVGRPDVLVWACEFRMPAGQWAAGCSCQSGALQGNLEGKSKPVCSANKWL